MIAASEPLEFFPLGRQAVEEHPGPFFLKPQKNTPTDSLLISRLQNVNISSDTVEPEFWIMREICETGNSSEGDQPRNSNSINGNCINSEEELYAKKNTAVWSRGNATEQSVPIKICFTCDTPIKFAFFCNKNFLKTENIGTNICPENDSKTAIGLIDSLGLRVYCSNGEDFRSGLDFDPLNVWVTENAILIEKEAANIMIETQSVLMPRVFSLTHPLDECCPVLTKAITGATNYFTEAGCHIVYASPNDNILMMYDDRLRKHFIALLRKATKDEIKIVGADMNAQPLSQNTLSLQKPGFGNRRNVYGEVRGSTSSINFTHKGFKLGKIGDRGAQPTRFAQTRLALGLSYNRLCVHSIPADNANKNANEVSLPVLPEFCLQSIWTENNNDEQELPEKATAAFMHQDIIGQKFLCYLLTRTGRLCMLKLTKRFDKYTFGPVSTITAKDAVCLNQIKMVAVLDATTGTLILYTGPVIVAKVHVAGILSTASLATVALVNSFHFSFPRRSSASHAFQNNSQIDDIHMLSPVYPLEPYNNPNTILCTNLRDPVGNRLTLVYPGGRMFRIALPLINDSLFITKCINALQQVLNKELAIHLFAKWYGSRNAPGSKDFNIETEWNVFKNVLSELLGRSVSSLNELNPSNSSEKPKKRKKDESPVGCDEDWEYLVNKLATKTDLRIATEKANMILHNDDLAPLYPYIPIVFHVLHLLYEDLKLDLSLDSCLKYLSEYLYQLASDMQLHSYCVHYALDFPELSVKRSSNYFSASDAEKMNQKELLTLPVPNLFKQISDVLKDREIFKYPFYENVNENSRNVIQIISLISHGHKKFKNWFVKMDTAADTMSNKNKRCISLTTSRSEQVLELLLLMGIERHDIERLPAAIHYIIAHALEYSRLEPPIGSSPNAYKLLLRPELISLNNTKSLEINNRSKLATNVTRENALSSRVTLAPGLLTKKVPSTTGRCDGMENIDTKLFRLRFPDDLRTEEVRKILNSSEPVQIDITQLPGVSDHEFIEEQERQLFALCTRTMALSMGRGMLTLRTTIPTSTQSMPIPKLCLTGKEPIKGATIEMQQIEFPPNMSLYPLFHNGVAAGLRIPPDAKQIDSNWIVYNRPKGLAEVTTDHAGFVMGLGFNGHLKMLSYMSMFEYLVKCDELTSIGLILGISATYKGTMNPVTTRLLSIHIESLLPATALELDIPQNVQVAALMGVGLVFQGTAKRYIAEVLVQEIGRPPGPEMENSIERESYALAAGLALGLVTLGHGESPAGLRDLQLPDTLHYYMVGGNKRPLTGSQKEKYKLPSFQVREGDIVNIDVTAPGATLALGLMFFNTGNQAIAEWMKPPDTSYLLDLIRPDLLLLRIISKGLILWNDIEPTTDWLFGQFPASLEFDLKRGPSGTGIDIDHEANCQAYCNIIAGASFCIGLRYAGTENPVAFKTLKKTINMFLTMTGQYVGEYAGKATVECSINMILISLALVCAGSGNLDILRIIRFLRSRIGPTHPQVTYGSHMAIHMALGFLFLGAGRYTLSRKPEAIAALVCALYPKFPNHSNDNRYHLQAFRHLYVLAVEPRLFLPRDVETGKLCISHISYIEIGSDNLIDLGMAPCLLPELETLKTIKVNDTNYWPVCFERDRNWDTLREILKNCGCIDLKKRAGCLSHLEDPHGFKSLLAQTLTAEQFSCWEIDIEALLAFSSDEKVQCFMDRFLRIDPKIAGNFELRVSQLLKVIYYNCLTKDKMHILPIFFSLLSHQQTIKHTPTSFDIWQFKIIDAFQRTQTDDILVTREVLQSTVQNLTSIVESWGNECAIHLKKFVSTGGLEALEETPTELLRKLCAVITYYDLIPNALKMVDLSGKVNYLRLIYEFKKFNLETTTINCLAKLLKFGAEK